MRMATLASAAVLLTSVLGTARERFSSGSRVGTLSPLMDSAGDTVFVKVGGGVPETRRLVEEVRIAPGLEDTTLFTQVSEFTVDRAGRFWVYDGPTNSVLFFTPQGRLIRRIGRQGGGPGEFRTNNGMLALGDTGLALLDYQNARISFFSAAGDFQTSWRTPTGFFTNNGLLGDRSGSMYLKRPVTPPREGDMLGRMGLVRVKAGGTLADSLLPPDLPVKREVYVVVSKDGGARSSGNSQFAPSYYWSWHPDGFFVVAHGGNYEIVLVRPGQQPLAIRRELPKVPIAEEERAEERARILSSMQRTNPSWSWTGPPIPQAKAPLLGLFIARDGRVWARVAAPSERIPKAELDVPRDARAPVTHFRTPVVYEVFEANGRFLGRVAFPRRSRLMEAEGNTVWALLRDENDLPAVVRFRIEPGLR